jgi:hypothetical protein
VRERQNRNRRNNRSRIGLNGSMFRRLADATMRHQIRLGGGHHRL